MKRVFKTAAIVVAWVLVYTPLLSMAQCMTATAVPNSPAACFGQCVGSIDLQMSGGTPPYSYTWSNGKTDEDINGLCAGIYSVTVRDVQGCVTGTSATITTPQELDIKFSKTNAVCYGGLGSVSISGSGGVPPYTFLDAYDNILPVNPVSLPAGTYLFKVKDVNGCMASGTVTITEPDPLSLDVFVQANCYNPLGTLYPYAMGGAEPYTYYDELGNLIEFSVEVPAGMHTIRVVDGNGCEATREVEVTIPQPINIAFTKTDAGCSGACTGAIDLTITGGSIPRFVYWDNGEVMEDLENLCPGTYTVSVNDYAQCFATQTIEIGTGISPIELDADITHSLSCLSIGSVDLHISGGQEPYAISWSNGASSEDISGLGFGSYTVTVTDANGCSASATYDILSPPNFSDIVKQTLINNCRYDSARLQVVISGPATTRATFYNGSGTEVTAILDSFRVQGTEGGYPIYLSYYTLDVAFFESYTIKDSLGCSAGNFTTTRAHVELLSLDADVIDPVCFGETGLIIPAASGGQVPYRFFGPGDEEFTTTLSKPAGTYTIRVEDGMGCTAEVTVTVNEPDRIGLVMHISADTVCENYGFIQFEASGGAGPYQLQVIRQEGGRFDFPGEFDTEILIPAEPGSLSLVSGFGPGIYVFQVRDQNGCTTLDSLEFVGPGYMDLQVDVSQPGCFGEQGVISALTLTGPADGVGRGFQSPYRYYGPDNADFTAPLNLGEGTYVFGVEDANGCRIEKSVTITAPAPILMDASSVDARCAGACDGHIDVAATGVQQSLVLTLKNSAGEVVVVTEALNVEDYGDGESSISYVFPGLCAGTYTVSGTDANGCSAESTVTITEPEPLELTYYLDSTECNDAIVNFDITGLRPGCGFTIYYVEEAGFDRLPVDYSTWYTRRITPPGRYKFLLEDCKGCQDTLIVEIAPFERLKLNLTAENPLCNSENGIVSATATGGAEPYTFLGPDNLPFTETLSVPEGTFLITVVDDKGCRIEEEVTITAPEALMPEVTATAPLCHGGLGSLSIDMSGGTGPYAAYLLGTRKAECGSGLKKSNTPSGATSLELPGLDYPCYDLYTEPVLMVFDPTYELAAGDYLVGVEDANGCDTIFTVIVPDRPKIELTLVATSPLCPGFCNGSIDLTATGGEGLLTYHWDNGAETEDLDNLCPGVYRVTVRDKNGCEAVDSVEVPENTLSVTLVPISLKCHGVCDGRIDLQLIGSTGPVYYTWSNGEITEDISGLCAGTYSVTVYAGQCVLTAEATLSEPPPFKLSANIGNPTCKGNCDGFAEAILEGGTPPYTYLWDNGEAVSRLEGLCADSAIIDSLTIPGAYIPRNIWAHQLVATDAKGCTAVYNFTLLDPLPLEITLFSEGTSCHGECDADIEVTATGVQKYLTLSWNDGEAHVVELSVEDYGDGESSVSYVIAGLCAGMYTISGVDANGCTAEATITVTEPEPLRIVAAVNRSPKCYASCDGYLEVTGITGGTEPYRYAFFENYEDALALNWAEGIESLSIGDLCGNRDSLFAGDDFIGFGQTYWFVVIDANGCEESVRFPMVVPMPLELELNAEQPLCHGANGIVSATATGGTEPYSFFGPGSEPFTGTISLSAGIHEITVIDANGCEVRNKVTITAPEALMPEVTATAPLCHGGLGSLSIDMSGGTGPYAAYLLGTRKAECGSGLKKSSTPSVATSLELPGLDYPCYDLYPEPVLMVFDPTFELAAGDYLVGVEDANGCDTIFTVIVPERPKIELTLVATSPLCPGFCNGSIDLTATGGEGLLIYHWDNGAETEDLENLCPGVYRVMVRDKNGCEAVDSVEVPENTLSVTLVPTDVKCHGDCDGRIDLQLSGSTGPVYYTWSNGEITEDISGLCAGTYSVTVYAGQCVLTAETTLSEPPGFEINGDLAQPTCAGDCDGFAEVLLTGGTLPYTYAWSNGETSSRIENLCAKDYTAVDEKGRTRYLSEYQCVITDANGCIAEANFTLMDPLPLEITLFSVGTSCHGACDADIDVSATGVQKFLTLSWNDGESHVVELSVEDYGDGESSVSYVISGLCAGTYTISGTDTNGCSTEATILVTEPEPLEVQVSVASDASCAGETGGLNVAFTGGTGPYDVRVEIPDVYSYMYQTMTGEPRLVSVPAGDYTITVIDKNNCRTTEMATILEPELLHLSLSETQPLCSGENGSVSATATGGTEPYSFFGPGSEPFTGTLSLPAGIHEITVIDANGCVDRNKVTITAADPIDYLVYIDRPTCPADCDGHIMVVIEGGGTAPYIVALPDGSSIEYRDSVPEGATMTASNIFLENLCAGEYAFSIRDANGCNVNFTVPEFDYVISESTTYYTDADGDGYGDPAAPVQLCSPQPGYVPNDDDCDDTNDKVHPNSVEIDGNGIDDDCDGTIDNSCIACPHVSADVVQQASCSSVADGKLSAANTVFPCPPDVVRYAWNNGETTMEISGLLPGSYSVVITAVFHGGTDSCARVAYVELGAAATASIWHPDLDGDGYGNTTTKILACIPPPGYVPNDDDCNDQDRFVYPGAPERCNGVDDDCDGTIDEGFKLKRLYPDRDGDGFGDAAHPGALVCKDAPGWVPNRNDCNDQNPNVHPGAREICNGIDDNCNGKVDEGLPVKTYYADADGDGRGNANSQGISSCGPMPGYVANRNDCNDANPQVYKGAKEKCNGIDDNCNGRIDEGCGNNNAKEVVEADQPSDLMAGRQVTVYPNPFREQFNIRMEGFEYENVRITIVNTLGQVLLDKEVAVDGFLLEPVDVSGFAPGLYAVNIRTAEMHHSYNVVKAE